jgi:hypothetical protein
MTQPPSFDEDRFLALLAPVLERLIGGNGAPTVKGRIAGNINRVLELEYAGHRLGARVTVDARHFRYERDVIKEVLAVLLLSYGSGRIGDATLRRIVDGALSSPVGKHVGHAWVRPILYYDWSCADFPCPFFLFEWIDGDALWRAATPARYAQAGVELARLHGLRFENFYQDLFAIDRHALEWRQRFRAAWEHELAEAAPRLPAELLGRLRAIDLDAIPPGPPCLIHNDYSGANILVVPDGLKVIDWDNWVVDCPELDTVKMKYWTALGPDGRLVHDAALYGAFRDGYDGVAAEPLHPARLAAYERLWLLRTFNFESSRADAAPTRTETVPSWRAAYPGPAAYLDFLSRL